MSDDRRMPRAETPLRICFVCDELPPAPGGGIGSFVRTVGTRLRELGHDVIVTGHYPRKFDWNPRGPVVDPILPHDREFRRGPFTGRRMLRDKVNAIHTRTPLDVVEWPSYQGPFLSNVPGTTDVVRLHSPLPARPDRLLSPRAWFMQWMRRRALTRIPNWIAVSRWVRDDSLVRTGAKPRRETVIPNAVDCGLFHPPESDAEREPLILFVGALVEIKGAFTLARALRAVLKEHPRLRALFVGRDPDGTGAARVCQEAGAEQAARVEIRAQASLEEVAGLMRRAMIVAGPGDLESFGMVWAEAMASGAALIGSTTAAGPETVPADEAGLLVSPGSVPALVRALDDLITTASLRERLGARAREIAVGRYALGNVSNRTLSFYRDCLADRAQADAGPR